MQDGRIEVVSIVDRVYDALRARILDGSVAPGARLRQEALADELGVSRTPLREALRRLASEGLVELEANRGARVPALTRADLMAAYDARLAIEPGAARLAAVVRDEAALRRMDGAIAAHRRASGSAALFEANRAFHLALVAAAANEHLSRLAEFLWAARIGALIYGRQDETAAEVAADADEHAAIAAAVAAADADEAERLVREHVARARGLFAVRG